MKQIKWIFLFIVMASLTACTPPSSEKGAEHKSEVQDVTETTVENDQMSTELKGSSLLPISVSVGEDVLWTFIDDNGQYLSEPQWEQAEAFSKEGLAIVQKDGLRGLIDTSGQLVVPCSYTYIAPFAEGLAVATKPNQVCDVLSAEGQVAFTREGLGWQFSEGLLSFMNPQNLYGYVDTKGSVVIKPEFMTAGGFEGGLALVEQPAGGYALIDEKGVIKTTFEYNYMWSIGEGLFAHGLQSEDGSMAYGINDVENAILLEADFDQIDAFDHGRAIVSKWEDYESFSGVVDTLGNFVVPLQKGVIGTVGNGYFALVENGLYGSYLSLSYEKSALLSPEGKPLTDEIYYNLKSFDEELFSASDGVDTFLIDGKGKRLNPDVSVTGVGVLSLVGESILAEVDNRREYYSREGKLIWAENPVHVYDTVTVTQITKRINRFVLVAYPVLTQMASQEVQQKINDALYAKFVTPLLDRTIDDEMLMDESVQYTSSTDGNLLHIEVLYYSYGIGAAHGNYFTESLYFDLSSGALYGLKDIFVKDADFGQRLADEIVKLIPESDFADEIDPAYIEPIAGDRQFRLHPEGLEIYYTIYEVASYAAGEPGFTIPWENISDLVDPNSQFMQAYKGNN